MINIEIKDVHIGRAIRKRLEELKMSKSEFARQIGVPQQHINKLLDKETIDTGRLVKVCSALEFNFFALYCSFPTNVSAYLSAVALGNGDASNNVGDTALLSQLEVCKLKLEAANKSEAALQDQVNGLKDNVEQLKSNLRDKDEIIKLYKERM